jgi:DNA-binding response OmpR family regulator
VLEAFAAIEADPNAFDVVVADNRMPIVSGSEFVRRLRDHHFRGRIIVLSADVSREEEAEYRSCGVDALLPKPFSVAELRQSIGLTPGTAGAS